MSLQIHGATIVGLEVDEETRCAHYRGPRDIIAIKFKCCGQWFPCHQCHAELVGHAAQVWPKEEFDAPAILCGSCGCRLTIRQYLRCNATCPGCGRQFNPACARHNHFYFA